MARESDAPDAAVFVLPLRESFETEDREQAALVISDYLAARASQRAIIHFEIEGYSEAKRDLNRLESGKDLSDDDRRLCLNLRRLIRNAQVLNREPEIVLADASDLVINRFWQRELENEYELVDLLSYCFQHLRRSIIRGVSRYELFRRRDDGSLRWVVGIYLSESEEGELLQRNGVATPQAFFDGFGLDIYSFGRRLWFREVVPALVRRFLELKHIEEFPSADPNIFFDLYSWKAALG